MFGVCGVYVGLGRGGCGWFLGCVAVRGGGEVVVVVQAGGGGGGGEEGEGPFPAEGEEAEEQVEDLEDGDGPDGAVEVRG